MQSSNAFCIIESRKKAFYYSYIKKKQQNKNQHPKPNKNKPLDKYSGFEALTDNR